MFLAIFLTIVIGYGGFALTGKIAVVLGGGRGDLSFNDMGFKGASDAAQQFGLGMVTVQSTSAADFLPNLRNLARTEEFDVIISFGSLLADAITQASKEFPGQRFVTVGGVVPDRGNVMAVLFRENEMSALVGALAGMTAANHGYSYAGIVLGIEIPVLYHFEAGYRFGMDWGLKRYSEVTGEPSDVGLLYTYTGTFQDIAVGKTASEAMLAQGAASIYNVAGALGLGDLEAIAEYHETAGTVFGPPYYFGVDANQDHLGGGLHGLASGVKRIDVATYQAVESVVNGTFQGGITSLGLAEGGVGISDLDDLVEFIDLGVAGGVIAPDSYYSTVANWARNRSTVPVWIWQALDELEGDILDGTLTVPTADSRDEMEALRVLFGLEVP
ncbi:BMP family protein [Candidatus Bipolaricaulota bacterium]